MEKKFKRKNITPQEPNKFIQPFAHQQWKIMNRIIGNDEIEQNPKHQVRGISQFAYRFSKSFLGILGILILVMLVLGAIIIPFTTQDPYKTTSLHHEEMFGTNNILGTDGLGRDLWARLWYGLRFSFELAFMATLIDVFIGVVLGILMGQYKKFDMIMQWIIKVLSNIPTIIIMILMTLLFHPSFWILVLSLSLTGWIGMANQMRAQVRRASSYLWVTASKILGTPQRKIIMNYIPVIIPMLITQLVFTIPGAILSETSLAAIGLSIPGEATLGNMISSGAKIITIFPRYTLIPAGILVLTTASVQFIGNATQDALRRQR